MEVTVTNTPTRTIRYLGPKQVGAWFGVPTATVFKWTTRYADSHPTPEPDALIGDEDGREVRGWLPEREQEWRAWERGRPGRGAGGGRPPGSRNSASRVRRGVDLDHAAALIAEASAADTSALPEKVREALAAMPELVAALRKSES
ncbi:hypothetical protein [Sphaerisporangium aureirubrum]|uniref:Helix-turn-helix domain-containing protein n=1 Tax=Sphaerisporangium aureirubrum TaxID=1544736 RepID=A0ABW1NC55_9ACTN